MFFTSALLLDEMMYLPPHRIVNGSDNDTTPQEKGP